MEAAFDAVVACFGAVDVLEFSPSARTEMISPLDVTPAHLQTRPTIAETCWDLYAARDGPKCSTPREPRRRSAGPRW